MPYLGHNHSDGLDVSPDDTPPVRTDADISHEERVRGVVRRMASGPDDEQMLLEVLGVESGSDSAPAAESA